MLYEDLSNGVKKLWWWFRKESIADAIVVEIYGGLGSATPDDLCDHCG